MIDDLERVIDYDRGSRIDVSKINSLNDFEHKIIINLLSVINLAIHFIGQVF